MQDILDLHKQNRAQCLREPYSTIAGDCLIVKARKPGKWEAVRHSGQHNTFQTQAWKDCVAVLLRAYRNVK